MSDKGLRHAAIIIGAAIIVAALVLACAGRYQGIAGQAAIDRWTGQHVKH